MSKRLKNIGVHSFEKNGAQDSQNRGFSQALCNFALSFVGLFTRLRFSNQVCHLH